jgi:hypothetical protein
MIVTIHQPNYLPYLGYFDKMAKADVLIIYDTAEFVKEMFYHRNKIKTKQGPLWLTVPVKYKSSERPSIQRLQIDNARNWQKKHWASIQQSYAKAPYYKEVFELLESVYNKEWLSVGELGTKLIKVIAEYLGIKTKVVLASDYPIDVNLSAENKLLAYVKAVGGNVYLSGKTGETYLNEQSFNDTGIELRFQYYTHPNYVQMHGEFVKNLCILDLLFNHGSESKKILINDRK